MFYNPQALISLTLLCTLTLAAPSPLQSREIQGTVKCETTKGSPLAPDVVRMIDYLDSPQNRLSKCVQDNIFGSHCTSIAAIGFSKIFICGSGPSAAMYVTCRDAAEAARRILNECKWFSLVGGIYRFGNTPLEIKISR